MKTNKPFQLLDQHGNPSDSSAIRYVIISDNGKDVLDDPARKCPWWTYTRLEAERMKKNIERDFKRLVHVVTIENALVTIAKKRYGIDIKPPYTSKNIERQLIKTIIKQES